MREMDKHLVLSALRRLGTLATEEGLQLECCIYGGALMMLAYDAKVSTKDVDAVIRPRADGLRLAKRVGKEMELPEDWLNDQVKMFVAPNEDLRDLPLEMKGLHITSPTAGYLLAMKAMACRPRLPGYGGDLDDLQFLIRKMEITSVKIIQKWIDRYYPDDVIPEVDQETLRAIIAEVWS
jgi:hypothetical protein